MPKSSKSRWTHALLSSVHTGFCTLLRTFPDDFHMTEKEKVDFFLRVRVPDANVRGDIGWVFLIKYLVETTKITRHTEVFLIVLFTVDSKFYARCE